MIKVLIILAIIVLIWFVYNFLCIFIKALRKRAKYVKQIKLMDNMIKSVYDYIKNHTYLQMKKEIESDKLSIVAMYSYKIVKKFASKYKDKTEVIVYKDVQKWLREGMING